MTNHQKEAFIVDFMNLLINSVDNPSLRIERVRDEMLGHVQWGNRWITYYKKRGT